MAELELEGRDTSTPSIEAFVGDSVAKDIPPLMAHVTRNVIWVERTLGARPPLIVDTTRSGGLTRHRFDKEACEAILRRRSDAADSLIPGELYSWGRLADLFGFAVGYLNRAGGMPTLPAHSAVMSITHPTGGKSFDYEDYWDGHDLVYTGRGQVGNQKLVGANLDVADNRRRILVFEGIGPSELKYLGTALCVESWPDSGLDRNGNRRRIYRFRLRFGSRSASRRGVHRSRSRERRAADKTSEVRRLRPFDPARRPTPAAPPNVRTTAEETAALREKATQAHHDAVCQLATILSAAGWTEPQEVERAIDLCAAPGTRRFRRVLFEVKTLNERNGLQRTRAGLAQLLEYRLLYGEPDDELCLVTTAAVNANRVRLLRALGVDIAWIDQGNLVTTGQCISRSVTRLLASSDSS
jgi:hypothetical protein